MFFIFLEFAAPIALPILFAVRGFMTRGAYVGFALISVVVALIFGTTNTMSGVEHVIEQAIFNVAVFAIVGNLLAACFYKQRLAGGEAVRERQGQTRV